MTRPWVDWETILNTVENKEAAAVEVNERFDRLILPLLTDDQLQFLIEQSQAVLDKRHGLNRPDLVCPKCGQTETFRVETYAWADVHEHGAEIDLDSDPAWGAESACNCTECEYTGVIRDYLDHDGEGRVAR